MDKTMLRKILSQTRKEQAASEETSRRVMEQLFSLAEFQAAKTVLFYAHTQHEVQTLEVLAELLSAGEKRIAVPYCDKQQLRLTWIESLVELEPGAFGILEPTAEVRKNISRQASVLLMDLVVVPGVGFDRFKNRLGHGNGFYDRLFQVWSERRAGETREEAEESQQREKNRLPLLVGVGYACQLVEQLVTSPHDVRMDVVVTETAIYR